MYSIHTPVVLVEGVLDRDQRVLVDPHLLVADEWGQHYVMGPLQSNDFCRIGKKDSPWHFWEDKSKLPGEPKKSLCQKDMKFAVVLTPFVPFLDMYVDAGL